MVFNRLLVKLY